MIYVSIKVNYTILSIIQPIQYLLAGDRFLFYICFIFVIILWGGGGYFFLEVLHWLCNNDLPIYINLWSEMQLRGKNVRSWCERSSYRSFMVDLLSYFSFQPVLHDWCNKGRAMCYPVCGLVHIKYPLLLIEKNSQCSGGNGFPLLLSKWFFTICPTPYDRKYKR